MGDWLPADFDHPRLVAVGDGHHLRPIRAGDVDLDLPAVNGSRDRLYAIYGLAWGWPPPGMTREQDEEDLARHERETAAHESFNYALFDDAETELLGCVYLDPATRRGYDAEISWWVVDREVGTDLERRLEQTVPAWIAAVWPFTAPAYVGWEINWTDYLELPP